MNTLADTKQRQTVTEDSVLGFGRGIRMRYDERREAWVLMAPERVLVLDEMAATILSAATEKRRTVGVVIDELAAEADAPRDTVGADVIEFLQTMTDKRFLTT